MVANARDGTAQEASDSLTFRTAFITCPWLIGNRNTSPRNLRIVSTDMWQAPF
jgi:hypothetical protein